MITSALWIALGYLLGSVPFGLVITRALGLGDLRKIGSGNIGATNVLRTGNKPAAAATLILDAGKGAIAVGIVHVMSGPQIAHWAGLAAFVGHCFPVWLRFHGGKGVATFLGTVLALAWPVGLAACATWLAVVGVVRISSLGALAAAAATPIWMWVLDYPNLVPVGLIMTGVIFWRHRQNIERLRAGTEPTLRRKL
ncbi:glycerol-3-phosphate 1-O-acyltransferase PlsY [Citreimonas salinaria]|uniref:Glycerol-3-phosphate acyltransferase n=1 Tax=Citreimonas salinaria TaxID=321339 RepID=A0A1H3HPA8_9RHOB|nr:glycerol-3-phosphate 1-O-acyltransferase PlsY [Citreimonas salinaria]SDY17341.1 acyl-phosphate glycerol-3-phosphate acyltransferase [Citreimonas salinaria]